MGRKSFITGVSGDFLRYTSNILQNVRTLMSRLCIVLRVIDVRASVFLATAVGYIVKKKGNLDYPNRHLCKWSCSSVNGQNLSSQSRNRPM